LGGTALPKIASAVLPKKGGAFTPRIDIIEVLTQQLKTNLQIRTVRCGQNKIEDQTSQGDH